MSNSSEFALGVFPDVGGWDSCRLDQVEYFPDSELAHAFDFVDPIDIIRAAHLIPRFAGNRTSQYLVPSSSVASDNRSLGDWSSYYVSRFPDRDMLMRFIGMGIGHLSCGKAPDFSAGVDTETLNAAYEYGDAEDSAPDKEGSGDGVTRDDDDLATSDEENNGVQTDEEGPESGESDEESVGGQTDEEDDGARRDDSDDDEPSW